MSKKESEIRKSDVMELIDRSKLTLLDLLSIAQDRNFDIEIRLTSDGSYAFEVTEDCGKKHCYKRYYQSEGYVSYTETSVDVKE